jgi:hypothetical protein
MVIGDEIKRFALGLQRHRRLHHAKIIPDVQGAAWLEAGKNAHVFFVYYLERNRDISNPCIISAPE